VLKSLFNVRAHHKTDDAEPVEGSKAGSDYRNHSRWYVCARRLAKQRTEIQQPADA
jgi:hypothetical protein